MKHLAIVLIILFSIQLSAQTDSTKKIKGSFETLFYIDAYYSYDLNNPYDNKRPDFLFQYSKHNAMSINMAVAAVNYKLNKFEANLGINIGDFPATNMSHETQLLQTLYAANVSYEFLKNLTFTAGLFSSHMGFESALSSENLMTSHSLASEWTPYYLAGAKLEYQLNKKLMLGITAANGNQKIQDTPGNTDKLIGLQANYKLNDKVTVNYSNMYYNDSPDTAAQRILYNNLYTTIKLKKKIDIVAGFDYAMNNNTVSDQIENVFVASLLARYKINSKYAIGGRFEHYNDEHGVYIVPPTAFSFVTNCYTLNLDYSPISNLKFRLEGRMFSSENPIFRDDNDYNPSTSTTIKYRTLNSNILFSVQAKF